MSDISKRIANLSPIKHQLFDRLLKDKGPEIHSLTPTNEQFGGLIFKDQTSKEPNDNRE